MIREFQPPPREKRSAATSTPKRLPLCHLQDRLIEEVSPVRNDSPQDQSEEQLVKWLIGIFKARDVYHTQRTATVLTSCLQAGNNVGRQDLVHHAREYILRISSESWRLLQDKDLESIDGFVQWKFQTLAQKSQGLSSSEVDRLSSGARSMQSGKTTASAPASPRLFLGNSSAGTYTGAVLTTPSASLASLDLEDQYSSNASPSRADDDTRSASSNRIDEWEYEFMLNGVFERVLYRLKSGRQGDVVDVLEDARDRVVKCTVQRWVCTS